MGACPAHEERWAGRPPQRAVARSTSP